jgi:hypothetical protein
VFIWRSRQPAGCVFYLALVAVACIGDSLGNESADPPDLAMRGAAVVRVGELEQGLQLLRAAVEPDDFRPKLQCVRTA